MLTFAQLLCQYMERSGISDAELARSVGVRRQTIFRWKQGLVKRPRFREDVLAVAARLRLAPSERDALLLSAGFQPEDPDGLVAEAEAGTEGETGVTPAADSPSDAAPDLASDPAGTPSELSSGLEPVSDSAGQSEAEGMTSTPGQEDTPDKRSARRLLGMAGVVLLVLLIGFAGLRFLNRPTPSPSPSATASATEVASPTDAASGQSVLVAGPDETLLLVAEFSNYGVEQGFNVAGRISEALMGEINQAALERTRVAVWPQPVDDGADAAAALAESGAAALVWGEYDSGRVRVNIAQPGSDEGPGWVRFLSSPGDLASIINIDLPNETRLLALTTLGQLFREQGEYVSARSAFKRALDLHPDEADTEALLHFLLATVLERGEDGDPAAAISEYSRVIPLRPEWVNARYNRGSAYLQRYYSGGEPDLLDAAIADFGWVLEREPAFSDAFLNRGIAYYERNQPGDLDHANADMTAALARSPNSYRVYFNRGLLNIRRDDPQWQSDLTRALQRNPGYAPIHSALCWGYALDEEPEEALPHCQEALSLDPAANVHDSLGIVYAQLGRRQAALAEFEAYLTWLRTLPPQALALLNGPLVEAWIDALEAGDMPFNQAALDKLR